MTLGFMEDIFSKHVRNIYPNAKISVLYCADMNTVDTLRANCRLLSRGCGQYHQRTNSIGEPFTCALFHWLFAYA